MTAPAPSVNLGFCNPYGAETGGPRRVLGGLYGPASAATPGLHLPAGVAQGEWTCPQRAVVRCRMVCRCGHRGQVMALCSWHDETNYRGEYVGGQARQVKETVRVRGHYEEIQRRQAGSCPKCLYPADTPALQRESDGLAWQLKILNDAGLWHSKPADQIRDRIESIGHKFDRLRAAGVIHNCPLTLVEVS